MAWVWLLVAGVLEVVWALALKQSNGFTRWVPNVVMAAGLFASFWFLSLAFKEIPMGTAYAVWTGIGAAGIAILGMVLYGEPISLARIGFLVMVLIGIAGLKLAA
ncbi:QacE family quaternary ammonium compound efflux SMR transporter [Aliidongia dinghuensis]|uniref:Guanidinium exporter n=1 Tax=Aliidongia dinghuensis TaxID=1867774 RepID=A0A8J2YVN8_9PROT|nr:multidrug efflux SMR transporter [Aliidongia dinghuensis]GGF22433.1 QacE family quaternary ammonium compound efflux SMR transporter [Aliidongia dinghuensis]